MNCMKCGREVTEGSVFCPDCLADMEKFPVRPGTVVLLPKKDPPPPKKSPRKKKPTLTPEEQIPQMKKKIWTLRIISILLILLLCAISIMTIRVSTELDWQKFLGQNYHTAETKDPTS